MQEQCPRYVQREQKKSMHVLWKVNDTVPVRGNWGAYTYQEFKSWFRMV